MKSARRIVRRIWLPVALLVLSLIAHTLVLQFGGVLSTTPEALSDAKTIEVVMIEEVKIVPVPPPTPEPTPEPTPLPVEEILTHEKPEADPIPMPTPTPQVTPKPTPKPEAPKQTPATKTQPAAVPRGKMVEARPDYASNPPPRYPDIARRKGWEGEVIIRAQVNAAGRVTSASVIRKSRYAVLDQAAVAAVRKWKFKPRTVGGQSVDATVEVPVNFTLRR
jgi:protein TonB